MWHGDMTEELSGLYRKYFDQFGTDPGGYEELDYGPGDYGFYNRHQKVFGYRQGIALCGKVGGYYERNKLYNV